MAAIVVIPPPPSFSPLSNHFLLTKQTPTPTMLSVCVIMSPRIDDPSSSGTLRRHRHTLRLPDLLHNSTSSSSWAPKRHRFLRFTPSSSSSPLVPKVSEGEALSLPPTWSIAQGSDQGRPPKMKAQSRLFTFGLIASWYSSNIGVLLLNKYLLSNYGFRYPIFLTMCHMTACSLLSYIAIAWLKVVPMQTIRSRVQFFKISALSFIFCISVVFGNISLRYLPVSFNQAIGATTPFFTAVFAYLMTFKREAWLTYVTLIPVVTGVIIASGGEPSFHLFGFIICVAATAARALKTVLQGILLSSEGEKLNSMNLLLYMAPMAVVFLLPATLIMEENVVGITLALARDDVKIIWYLLFNSALAYFVNLTNFLVTKHTSALTLQVLGNAKGAVAVVVSILIFRNPVSVTGMLGYTLTVCGVILYSEAKKRSNKTQLS